MKLVNPRSNKLLGESSQRLQVSYPRLPRKNQNLLPRTVCFLRTASNAQVVASHAACGAYFSAERLIWGNLGRLVA